VFGCSPRKALLLCCGKTAAMVENASWRKDWQLVRLAIYKQVACAAPQVLCDRLGIFVDGQLVCVGAPKEITARYGGYLVRLGFRV
jgi:hypothetical protein